MPEAEIEAIHAEILRRLSPEQKLRTIHSLRETAWNLKAAWIRRCEPGLTEPEVQERVRQNFLYAFT